MIGHQLSNKNESATVAKFPTFGELNTGLKLLHPQKLYTVFFIMHVYDTSF